MVRACRAGLAALLAVAAVTALADGPKPKVIVMVDGELLHEGSAWPWAGDGTGAERKRGTGPGFGALYTCDVDLKAIIETSWPCATTAIRRWRATHA